MKPIHIFLILLPLFFSTQSPAQSLKGLSIELILESDTIHPLEIWHYKVKISNVGDEPLLLPVSFEACNGVIGSCIRMEIRNSTYCKWYKTKIIGGYILDQPWVSFEPGKSVELKLRTITPNELLDIGENEFRVLYFREDESKHDTCAISQPVKVVVTPFTGPDLQAYNYLKDLREPKFIFASNVCASSSDTNLFSHTKDIISLFPESIFAGFAHCYRSNYFYNQAERFAFLDKSEYRETNVLSLLRVSKYHMIEARKYEKKYGHRFGNSPPSNLLPALFVLYNNNPPDELLEEFDGKYGN